MVLASFTLRYEYRMQLESCGIKLRADGTVFLAPTIVQRYLLKDTDWTRQSIRQLLLRVDGASEMRERLIGEKQKRGVAIPISALGLEIE